MKRKDKQKIIDSGTTEGIRPNALRKMKRLEILDIMLEQQKQLDAARKELAETQARLAEAEAKLADRTIITENAGSLAKAALELNGIFEAAQKAAEDYVHNVKLRADSALEAEMEAQRAAAAEEEPVEEPQQEGESDE